MKEYPSTSKAFKVNGKKFTMRQFSLGLQADIEDENVDVTIVDVIHACTDMKEDDIKGLDAGQAKGIFEDIQEFTYTTESQGDKEPKKQ